MMNYLKELFSPEQRWYTILIVFLATAVGLLAAYMGPAK